MKITAVIMAGGKGERFWPQSRTECPKQFLSLTGDGKSMIRLTAERHLSLVAWEDMFVVTSEAYAGLVREHLPEIPEENILTEPMAKNTAPCIGYAAAVIEKKYGDAVMLVLASDHLIKLQDMYMDTMTRAAEIARDSEHLITIGITPAYPETGYGYIHFSRDRETGLQGVYAVSRFVEKPDLNTAKEYLASGQYLWNSGMFVWKVSTILTKFKELLPDTYKGLVRIGQAFGTAGYRQVLAEEFASFRSESIDYGIMEKTDQIYALPGNFGWDDVGSWLALERINQTDGDGNVTRGDVIAVDTEDSVVVGNKKLIAAVGLRGVIVVDTDDAILICAKDSAQDVKKVIETLKKSNRTNML